MVGKDVKGYADYREVLQRQDIDVVHIATPPHWHGLMSVEAARAGKDIWCEKPMTRTIGEGMRVVEEVNRHGRMFRLNTWFRFKDTVLRPGHRRQAAEEDRPERRAGLAAHRHGQRHHRLRLEVLLERPHRPEAAAGAAGARLRHVAGAGALQALQPRARARELPRLLGLRRRRPRRHGPALPRPGPVPARQGRHEPGAGGRGRAAAALRRRRLVAPDRIHLRRRLQDHPGRREPRHRRAPTSPGRTARSSAASGPTCRACRS